MIHGELTPIPMVHNGTSHPPVRRSSTVVVSGHLLPLATNGILGDRYPKYWDWYSERQQVQAMELDAACAAVPFVIIPFALAYLRRSRKLRSYEESVQARNVSILYGTTTGTSRRMAHEFKKKLSCIAGTTINVYNMKDYDFDTLDSENIVFILCSTWNYGEAPETARPFVEWLKDLASDFRISKNLLSKVRFAVMGLGGEVYAEHYCTAVSVLDPLLFLANAC